MFKVITHNLSDFFQSTPNPKNSTKVKPEHLLQLHRVHFAQEETHNGISIEYTIEFFIRNKIIRIPLVTDLKWAQVETAINSQFTLPITEEEYEQNPYLWNTRQIIQSSVLNPQTKFQVHEEITRSQEERKQIDLIYKLAEICRSDHALIQDTSLPAEINQLQVVSPENNLALLNEAFIAFYECILIAEHVIREVPCSEKRIRQMLFSTLQDFASLYASNGVDQSKGSVEWYLAMLGLRLFCFYPLLKINQGLKDNNFGRHLIASLADFIFDLSKNIRENQLSEKGQRNASEKYILIKNAEDKLCANISYIDQLDFHSSIRAIKPFYIDTEFDRLKGQKSEPMQRPITGPRNTQITFLVAGGSFSTQFVPPNLQIADSLEYARELIAEEFGLPVKTITILQCGRLLPLEMPISEVPFDPYKKRFFALIGLLQEKPHIRLDDKKIGFTISQLQLAAGEHDPIKAIRSEAFFLANTESNQEFPNACDKAFDAYLQRLNDRRNRAKHGQNIGNSIFYFIVTILAEEEKNIKTDLPQSNAVNQNRLPRVYRKDHANINLHNILAIEITHANKIVFITAEDAFNTGRTAKQVDEAVRKSLHHVYAESEYEELFAAYIRFYMGEIIKQYATQKISEGEIKTFFFNLLSDGDKLISNQSPLLDELQNSYLEIDRLIAEKNKTELLKLNAAMTETLRLLFKQVLARHVLDCLKKIDSRDIDAPTDAQDAELKQLCQRNFLFFVHSYLLPSSKYSPAPVPLSIQTGNKIQFILKLQDGRDIQTEMDLGENIGDVKDRFLNTNDGQGLRRDQLKFIYMGRKLGDNETARQLALGVRSAVYLVFDLEITEVPNLLFTLRVKQKNIILDLASDQTWETIQRSIETQLGESLTLQDFEQNAYLQHLQNHTLSHLGQRKTLLELRHSIITSTSRDSIHRGNLLFSMLACLTQKESLRDIGSEILKILSATEGQSNGIRELDEAFRLFYELALEAEAICEKVSDQKQNKIRTILWQTATHFAYFYTSSALALDEEGTLTLECLSLLGVILSDLLLTKFSAYISYKDISAIQSHPKDDKNILHFKQHLSNFIFTLSRNLKIDEVSFFKIQDGLLSLNIKQWPFAKNRATQVLQGITPNATSETIIDVRANPNKYLHTDGLAPKKSKENRLLGQETTAGVCRLAPKTSFFPRKMMNSSSLTSSSSVPSSQYLPAPASLSRLTGKTITLLLRLPNDRGDVQTTVDLDESIGDLKDRLVNESYCKGYNRDQLGLLYRGRNIEDYETARELDLKIEGVTHLVFHNKTPALEQRQSFTSP